MAVDVEDRAAAPREPPPERVRDLFFEELPRMLPGLLRFRDRELRLGPLPLLGFGPPERVPGGWRWPIRGGMLAREPGGWLSYAWRDGELVGRVEGYRPRLPSPVYELTQLPFHHLVTRLFLLRLREPQPPAGAPAPAGERALAAAFDLGLCLGAAAILRPRRPLRFAAGLLAGYTLAGWSLGGTAGERLLGLRVAASDGRPLVLGQALLRLLAGGRRSGTALFAD